MKKGKKILIAILSILSALCFLTAIGCRKASDSTEKDVATGSLGLTFEYMSDAEIPLEHFEGVTEEEILNGNVLFRFTSPEYTEKKEVKYDVYKSFSPRVFCDRVGTWLVACIYDGNKVCKSFEVKDQTKPELDVPELAYDVFASEETEYYLPQRTYFDLSSIDKKSVSEKITLTYTYYELEAGGSIKLDGDNKPVIMSRTSDVNIGAGRTYKALPAVKFLTEEETAKYLPTEIPGVMNYSLSVKDEYGNEETFEAKWNVKYADWTPDSVKDGYYADYDSAGYMNSVTSGKASSYWYKSAVAESYLDEYTDADGKKATGVVKVTAPPSKGYSMGCFKFKLYKDVLKSDLESGEKFFVIRMLTTNENVSLRFGCVVWREPFECVHTTEITIEPNKWTYAVIPYSEIRDGNFSVITAKNGNENIYSQFDSFNEFQITFGTNVPKNVLLEDAVLYVDSVTLAERLSAVNASTFSLSSENVLSWEAVDSADYYEVIEDGVISYVNTNSYTVKNVGAPITVRAMSDNALKVSSDVKTPFIDVSSFGEYDVAKFDSRSYEALAMINEVRPGRKAADIKAEYKTEYTDKEGKTEENVLKVTTTAATSHASPADVLIRLPKKIVNGVTIRFLIKSSDAKAIYFRKTGHESHNLGLVTLSKTISDTKLDVWQTMYLDFTGVNQAYHDVIELLIQSGSAGEKHEVYFSFVQEGDHRMKYYEEENAPVQEELEASLQDSYLADFSDDKYVKLVEKSVRPSRVPSDMEVKRLASFEGENNVLKITTVINDNGIGDVLMWLPKATATNKLTIRLMVCESSVKTLYWLNPSELEALSVDNDAINFLNTGVEAKANKWQTVCVGYNNSTIKDVLEILVAGGNPGDTLDIYFAFVMDGDHRKALMDAENALVQTELAPTLEADYLADFASEDYVELIEGSYRPSRTPIRVNGEYLASFEGESNVLKVTARMGLGGIGDFLMYLPKGTSTNKMTLKFMVKSVATTDAELSAEPKTMYFNNPSSESAGSMDNNANVFFDSGISYMSGKWQIVTVNYTNSSVKNVLDVMLGGGKANGLIEIYFAFVMDGDHRETIANEENAPIRNALKDTLENGYLADFESAEYAKLVERTVRATTRSAMQINAEVLDSYKGENSVLKVTTTNNLSGIADFAIYLPKACTSGMTVKFMVENMAAKTMYWLDPGNSVEKSIDDNALVFVGVGSGSSEGVWQTMYINYASSSVKDVLEILLAGGAFKGTNTVYFSFIMDGDQRETIKSAELTARKTALSAVKTQMSDSLATNQLASFDSEAYKNFVMMMHGYNDRLTVEYLSEYEGETGVLKLTVEHNKFHSENSSDAAIMIDLVKALSEGASANFSVKYRFEQLNSGALPAAVEFRQTDVYGTMLTPKVTNAGGELSVSAGSWKTANASTNGLNKDSLVLYTYFGSGSSGYVLYLSEITDGTSLA